MGKRGLVLLLALLLLPVLATDCACDLSSHNGFCISSTYEGQSGDNHHYCCAPDPYMTVTVGGEEREYVWPGFTENHFCYAGVDTGGSTADGTVIIDAFSESFSATIEACASNGGEECDVNPVDGWGGYGVGICDSSDKACVRCNSNNVEDERWGAKSGEYDLEGKHADKKCEYDCGASAICDEKSPEEEFADPSGDYTKDKCTSSCQYEDRDLCEKNYGASASCDGLDIGDVCASDYCEDGVLVEYDGPLTDAGDNEKNSKSCSSSCRCEDTLEAEPYRLCDTECGADSLCNHQRPGTICMADYCSNNRLYEYDGAGTAAGDGSKNGATCENGCECDSTLENGLYSTCDTECGADAQCEGKMPDDYCANDYCDGGVLYEYDGAGTAAGNEIMDGSRCTGSCGCDDTLEDASFSVCNFNDCGADIECNGLQHDDICRADCGLYAIQYCDSGCGCPPCPTSCSSDADCASGAFCDVSEGACRNSTMCENNRDSTDLCEVYCGADPECDERGEGLFAAGEGCNSMCEYDNTPPSAPSLSSLPDYDRDGEIDLDWTESSDANGIDSYDVWRAETSPATGGEVIRSLNSTSTFDVRSDGPVFYVIRAYDNVGLHSDSNEVSTTVDLGVDSPAEVTPFPDYSTTGNVSVSWSGASDTNGVSHYMLWRKAGGPWSLAQNTSDTSFEESLPDDGYSYKIETFDSAENSANSSAEEITVDTAVDSAASLDPLGQYAQSTVSLSWSGASDINSISHYLVWRGTSSGLYDTSFDAGGNRDYDDSTVEDGKEYFYVVETFDDAGNSANSSEESVKADTSAPEVNVTSPSEDEMFSSSPIPLTFTPTDPSPSGWDDIFDCDWFLDGDVVTGTEVVNETPEDVDLAVAKDGDHSLYVICADEAGNTDQSETVPFVLDTTPPDYSYLSQNNSLPNHGEFVNVSARWTDTYEVAQAQLELNRTGAWESLDTVDVNASSGWTNFTIDVSECSNNFIHWRITAEDSVGNSRTTETMTFEVDRHPAVDTPSFSPDDDPETPGSQLDPMESSYRTQTASAIASDPNGGADIVDGECWYFQPGANASEDAPDHVEDAEVSAKGGLSEDEREVSCEHRFAYDDEPGEWTVRVWAIDTKGNNASADGTFDYMEGVFVSLNSTTVDWGTLSLSQDQVRSSDVIQLNNTGNVALQTYFRGDHFEGQSDNRFNLTIDHLELDDDSSAGDDTGSNPIISYSQSFMKYSPNDDELGVGETWPVWHYLSTPDSLRDQEYRGTITVCAAKSGEGGCT